MSVQQRYIGHRLPGPEQGASTLGIYCGKNVWLRVLDPGD